jgi:hypothetical protein
VARVAVANVAVANVDAVAQWHSGCGCVAQWLWQMCLKSFEWGELEVYWLRLIEFDGGGWL